MATTALQEGGTLAADAGTNIVVTEYVRYWHAVAGAMSHNKQTLQTADAGSNPGWCILITVATEAGCKPLAVTMDGVQHNHLRPAIRTRLVTCRDDSYNAVQDAASVERTAANPDDCQRHVGCVRCFTGEAVPQAPGSWVRQAESCVVSKYECAPPVKPQKMSASRLRGATAATALVPWQAASLSASRRYTMRLRRNG
jgi:hypothetical protein